MPIRTQLLQHIVYRYRDPVWVDDIDPVLIIIAATYRDHCLVLHTVLPVSTSKVLAGMKHKKK